MSGTAMSRRDLASHPRRSMRESFGEAMARIGESNPKVVALAADCLGMMSLTKFAQRFPRRAFNVGIAEQNLIGVAAGMATCGLVPFITGLAPFVTMRAAEQVRTDLGYAKLGVKMAVMYGGITQGIGGSTHHATEDLAILRSMANLTVVAPADGLEAYKATLAAVDHPGPVYIRLGGRDAEPVVYEGEYDFAIGRALTLREGSDLAIIATGTMVLPALWAADALAEKGVRARVINMHTVKPLDREAVVKAAKETGRLLTVEEHNVLGGLGGAVAEVVVGCCPVPVRIVGIQDLYAAVGPTPALREKYGLTWENIAAQAEDLLHAVTA